MAWAPDYCTTAELKEYVRVSDSVDDAVMAWAITAASRAVDHSCNRQFGLVASPEARYYVPRYDGRAGRWRVSTDDLMTTDGLLVGVDLDDDQSYGHAVTDYLLEPRNAGPMARPWTSLVVNRGSAVVPTDPLVEQVAVTARWGWTSVPDTVVQATLLQASRLVARRDSPFGVAGSPDAGNELRLLARVDPDVEVALRPFRRVWGAL